MLCSQKDLNLLIICSRAISECTLAGVWLGKDVAITGSQSRTRRQSISALGLFSK